MNPSISSQKEYRETKAAFEEIRNSFAFGKGTAGDTAKHLPVPPSSQRGTTGNSRPAVGSGSSGGASTGGGSSDNATKLAALEKVCKTGVLTPEECATKRRALNQSGQPLVDQKKLAALEQACRAGVLTPEECESKKRQVALAGSSGPMSRPAPAPPPANEGGSFPDQPSQGDEPYGRNPSMNQRTVLGGRAY